MINNTVRALSSYQSIRALGALFDRTPIAATTARKGLLAVVDQGIVSGTNLATAVIVGRTCGASQLGVYSLAFTILVLITCVQSSIATAPYVYFSAGLSDNAQRRYAGSTLVQIAILTTLTVVGLLLLAGALGVSQITSLDARIILMLAATVPFVLLRDFLRRFAFAHLQVGAAVLLDGVVAAVQLGSLLLLARAVALGALTAHAAIGLSSAVVAIGGLLIVRRQFSMQWDEHVPVFRKNWTFGRWELASSVATVGHGYLIHWLLAFQLGTAATGIYAACLTVIALSRPLIHGLSNVLEPKTARAVVNGGAAEVRRIVRKITALFAVMIGMFAAAVALLGAPAVEMMYGDQFAGRGPLMAILALAAFVGVLDYGAVFGLRALQRTVWNFVGSIVGLGLATITAVALLPWLGLLGGSIGLLIGNIGAVSVRTMAFVRLSAKAQAEMERG